MPDGKAGAYRDIKRVLGSVLRYLYTYIGIVHNRLRHTLDLVSGYDGILFARLGTELAQIHTTLDLLEHTYRIAVGA